MVVKVNIRTAKASDVPHIHNIFSHYIQNTSTSFFFRPPPLSVVESRLDTAISRGLPFLVAINATNIAESEFEIVGYAYASPFRGTLQAYAPSVEVSIFMHPSWLGKGLGRTLMTALLDALKNNVHHAVEPGNEDHPIDVSVRNVFAVMAYDRNGPEKGTGDKLKQWYKSFGFQMVAQLRNVGFKMDRWMDTLYLQLDLNDMSTASKNRENPGHN